MAYIPLNDSYIQYTTDSPIDIPFCCKASIINWGNSIMVFRGREYGLKEGFEFDHGSDYVNLKDKIKFKSSPENLLDPADPNYVAQVNSAFIDYATVEIPCKK